jgi:two-component system, cell cycle sensor histidine kinase and response regulator CckA
MPSPGFEKRASGRTLLVVEDDADIRDALDGLLSTEGFRVAGCSNGREALDWLHASPKPDLILLDLMMPVMDGWQFRVAQKQDPELATIPVVALSADATAKAAAIDADAYLKKPVEYDTLLETLDRLLVRIEHRDLQARLAQTDRLTSLGTLAAGVAHEINNPLAYVLLNVGYALEELPKIIRPDADARADEVRSALDHARRGAERIRDIVRGLKTFSRPENEKIGPLDVIGVVESTLAMIANEIRHRATLVKDYAEVPEVLANEARLGQVLLNLLMNALQAMPEGRTDGNEVRVVVKSGGPDRVLIEVRDNGVGIPEQVRGRIFEPFFTTKPVGIGTGLGLAICHGIVASLGGNLEVESEQGAGSVFRVELPAAPRSMQQPAPVRAPATSARAGAPEPNAHRRRILVVDDEPVVCFSLERLLSSEGEVVALTSPKQALKRLEAGERFDVILCDVMMPEMDAMSLHERLSEVDPQQADRMAFITGGAFSMRARDFLEKVPNPRLSKPFDVEALLGLVRGYTAQ